MTDRRYARPRSPLQVPGRTSLPTFYGTDVYGVPTRRDILETPRSAIERDNAPFPMGTTTYNIKPGQILGRHSSVSEGRRNRSSTLDINSRPTIINAAPRSPTIHGADGRPGSPLRDPCRTSEEGGEYYSIPASSGRHRSHHRPSYSATMDNADMSRASRDPGLRTGPGREGARYPQRSKQVYPEALVRHADTVADDYGDDGYGYTNPRDLFEYDMNRGSRYSAQRRDSFDGPRPGRPMSISGYADIAPRSYDNRERGPPLTTRGLDKVIARNPQYDLQPLRVPPVEPGPRSPRREHFYEQGSPRKYSSRRPVSIYNDRPRREDYYDPRDEERRERREKAHQAKRYDEGRERGERGERGERSEAKEYERRRDHEKDDDDQERRNARETSGVSKKVHERRHHDKDDDYDNHKDHKSGRDAVAAGISLAATALGISGLTKPSKHDNSDDESDERGSKDEPRRRRDGEEHRRRREAREEKDTIDLSGRDPKERQPLNEKRDIPDEGFDSKEKQQTKDDKPVDLTGRNPQERSTVRDSRDAETESNDSRKDKVESSRKEGLSGSREAVREVSLMSEEVVGSDRSRKDREPAARLPFDYKNAIDIRALRDQLNKQDETPPQIPPKENIRQDSFERLDPQKLAAEDTSSHDERGRHDHTDSEHEMRPKARVVSPPREVKKLEESKPKGILRQPREKFPEDPVPIREGVAPLKDARKDGVPPDARWTKISRRMVNPEALDAGKERYEAREDFVIVLRVLTKEEIQAYAIATQQIRAAREQFDELEERDERRRRRRDRHERHKREREALQRERGPKYEYDHEHRRHRRGRDSHSESDSTSDEEPQKMIEGSKPRRPTFDFPPSSKPIVDSLLREDPVRPGTYSGYVRNPPRRM